MVDQVLQENLAHSCSSSSHSTEKLLRPLSPPSFPPTAAKVLEAALPVSTLIYSTPAYQSLQTYPLRHSTPHKGMQLPERRPSTCTKSPSYWNHFSWLQALELAWLVQLRASVLRMLVHKCACVCCSKVMASLWYIHSNRVPHLSASHPSHLPRLPFHPRSNKYRHVRRQRMSVLALRTCLLWGQG